MPHPWGRTLGGRVRRSFYSGAVGLSWGAWSGTAAEDPANEKRDRQCDPSDHTAGSRFQRDLPRHKAEVTRRFYRRQRRRLLRRAEYVRDCGACETASSVG
jgi:hypothetical protein